MLKESVKHSAPRSYIYSFSKEAQKCFCGTPSCRGFIGGDSAPVAITQRRETKGDTSKKKEKPSRATDFEDMVVSGTYVAIPENFLIPVSFIV